MKISFLVFFCACISVGYTYGQDSLLVAIEPVVITDNQLQNHFQKVQVLKEEDISRSTPLLTSLLNFNSLVYFKENGLGMVSSASFRGTSASQTAVIWNGININSQLHGQTDFNTINSNSFNEIAVKSGGGSVIYGSSAIGGSIHLNNFLRFDNVTEHKVSLQSGSYDSYGGSYHFKTSSEKSSLQLSFSRFQSQNNYKFLGTNKRNTNGEFLNNSFSSDFAYKINSSNKISFHSNISDAQKHFSIILPTETPTKYNDFNIRNLLQWNSEFSGFTSYLKLAHLLEEYKFFEDIAYDSHTFGRVESYIAKYDLKYNYKNKITFNGVVDYTKNKGLGTDVKMNTREVFTGSFLFEHFVSDVFSYEASLRKETTQDYSSPWLYSLGGRFVFSDFYQVKINGSKNYRIPTFNDMYWIQGGNSNLSPEISLQAEVTQEFRVLDFTSQITMYYNEISDMIRWIPGPSIWQPQNIDQVKAYGLELSLNYQKKVGNHSIVFKTNYGYTVSENKQTGYQLIYVPYHKANAILDYQYKMVNAYYQFLYVGDVFTRTDNNPNYLVDEYCVSNLGLEYDFGKNQNFKLGFKVQNFLNKDYQTVEARPLPGRNYNVYLIIKL